MSELQFEARLATPKKNNEKTPWVFVVLPQEISKHLPRRGRVTVDYQLNGNAFQQTLEPDGHLSHWLKISNDVLTHAALAPGDIAQFKISPVKTEPEPELPSDFELSLEQNPEAKTIWLTTTTLARLDWIHWIDSAKQSKTRAKRIRDACEMLASGKKRVCCFDPSGYYSKAFKAPEPANHFK